MEKRRNHTPQQRLDGNEERADRRGRLTRASVDIYLKNAGEQQIGVEQKKETHKRNGGDILQDLELRKQVGMEHVEEQGNAP